jgi:hypothetical protein
MLFYSKLGKWVLVSILKIITDQDRQLALGTPLQPCLGSSEDCKDLQMSYVDIGLAQVHIFYSMKFKMDEIKAMSSQTLIWQGAGIQDI